MSSMTTKELIGYYERGGPCVDYNDECRHRASGCPCTDTAARLRKLEAMSDMDLVHDQAQRIKKLEAVREALNKLVALKEYRDDYGKTDEYLKQKPIAWQEAREALADCGDES